MTARRLLHKNERDERGAVLIFAAVGMVVAILAAAMAIDVGSVIWRKRDLQVVADLAATDTAQQLARLPVPTQADADLFAQSSAERNNFDFDAAGNSLTTVLGTFDDTNGFVPSAAADATAVQVTARRLVDHTFVPGDGGTTVTTRAVASFTNEPVASFNIGSTLASLSPQAPAVLNPVLSRVLGTSTPLNLDLVGYQGLGAASVTFRQIAAADATFGSPDQLLASTVGLRRLAQATATALNSKGDPASVYAASRLMTFAAAIDPYLFVAVDELVRIEQPGQSAAADAQFNVFELLTGSALLANGTNTISVPNLTLGIPGLLQSNLELSVIEAPQFAVGPAKLDANGMWVTQARTAQVALTLNTNIHREKFSLLNLLELEVDLALPIVVETAKATGSLTDIRCADPQSTSEIDILVNRLASEARSAFEIAVTEHGLLGSTTVSSESDTATFQIPAGSETLTFLGPHDGSDVQTSGGTTLGLGTELANDIGSQIDLLGLLSINVFNDLVVDVTEDIDTSILDPIFDAFGVSIGAADVRTLGVECTPVNAKLVR